MRRTRQPPSGGGKERRKHAIRNDMYLDRPYQDLLPWEFSLTATSPTASLHMYVRKTGHWSQT